MRVFVTGATGWVGTALVRDLIANGHQVLGLARSDEGAAALAANGAEVLRGTLADLDTLRQGARSADAVAHTAFNHDFSRFAENAAEDRVAIETIGEVLLGSDRPLLVTSGFAGLTDGRPATEADPAPDASKGIPRVSEATAEALAARGLRAATVRLAPSVHGEGDHGFVSFLIGIAREKGASAYIEDGDNLWCGVHRFDAARVYRLALEQGVTEPRYHAVADESVPFKAIAQVIGDSLGLPVVSKTREEAQDHFGWFAMFAGANASASSEHTRRVLGWTPTGLDLLTDIGGAYYY